MACGHGGVEGCEEETPEERTLGDVRHLSSEREADHTPHTTQKGHPMTDNRMEATPIAGEHCRCCGDAKAPLVKPPCCPQWIGCDTAFVSFRGGGRCQVEHERLSLCDSHDEDQHGGPWESCQKCRDFWTPRDDKTSAENPINWPKY